MMGETVTGKGELTAVNNQQETLQTYKFAFFGKAQDVATIEALLQLFKTEARKHGINLDITKLPAVPRAKKVGDN